MSEIDDVFAGMMADAGFSEPAATRYITRSDSGFTNTLPVTARETISELCMVAAALAAAATTPALYDEESDQAAYSLLCGESLTEAAVEDCRIVAATVLNDTWQEPTLLALLRVTNSLRLALTSSVASSEDLAALRASNPEVAQLLDFLGAVQHEALDALM
jgi:hypothetical protein